MLSEATTLYKLRQFIVGRNLAATSYTLLTSAQSIKYKTNQQQTSTKQHQVSWINFLVNVQLFVCICDHVAHAPFMTMHLNLLTC